MNWLKRWLRQWLELEGPESATKTRTVEVEVHKYLVDAVHAESLRLGRLTSRVTMMEGTMRTLQERVGIREKARKENS